MERVVGLARPLLPVAVASLREPPSLPLAPLVTVVIATYNWSNVLRYAIESVRRQSYPNWELIVVGDGCTDDSEAVVRSFADPRIRWTDLPENSGSQSAPNNVGIALARGKYVAYLGHDDLWLPGHLALLTDALERTGAGLALTICESIGPPGSNVRMLSGLADAPLEESCRPSSLMHRRDIVEEIGDWRDYRDLVEPPDVEFALRAASTVRGAVRVPALTVCKFNSAWRRDSYRERRSWEQAAYASRMRRERLFVLRELVAYLEVKIRNAPERLPQPPARPAELPPGWLVTEWRRIRGLEPSAAGETVEEPVDGRTT